MAAPCASDHGDRVRQRDVIWSLGSGLAAIVSFLVRAQQAMPAVGVVSVASPGTSRFLGFFLPQMKEFGWENGGNFRVIARFAEGQIARFPALVDG
jgi:hypothetical protein